MDRFAVLALVGINGLRVVAAGAFGLYPDVRFTLASVAAAVLSVAAVVPSVAGSS